MERSAANLRRQLPRIPFVCGTVTLDGCHSEPALAGEESAVLCSGNAAGKQQTPPSGRNDKGEGNDAKLSAANRSPKGAADNSPGRQSWVNDKKETNSTLPKAVAGERSSQATGTTTDLDLFRALAKAGERLAEIHVHYEQQPECPLTKTEKAGEELDYYAPVLYITKYLTL